VLVATEISRSNLGSELVIEQTPTHAGAAAANA